MKEILAWAKPEDIQKEWDRLGISPALGWSGFGWRESDPMQVWQFSEEDFQTLLDDPLGNDDHWFEVRCAWRQCDGSNLNHEPVRRFNVNHHYMKGFFNEYRHNEQFEDGDEPYMYFKHRDLLTYLEEEWGATTEKNVTAITTDLAKINGLTLAQLFGRYHGQHA